MYSLFFRFLRTTKNLFELLSGGPLSPIDSVDVDPQSLGDFGRRQLFELVQDEYFAALVIHLIEHRIKPANRLLTFSKIVRARRAPVDELLGIEGGAIERMGALALHGASVLANDSNGDGVEPGDDRGALFELGGAVGGRPGRFCTASSTA